MAATHGAPGAFLATRLARCWGCGSRNHRGRPDSEEQYLTAPSGGGSAALQPVRWPARGHPPSRWLAGCRGPPTRCAPCVGADAALPTLFSRSASQRDCVWQRLAGEACKGYTLAPRWLEAQRVPRSAEKSGTSSTPGGKNDAPKVHRRCRTARPSSPLPLGRSRASCAPAQPTRTWRARA